MDRRFKIAAKITGGILATAAVAGAVSFWLTNKLVGIALDRNEDQGDDIPDEKISGDDPKMDLFMEIREREAERLESTPCEPVEITADDGIKLVGHFRKCKNAKRLIIAMHGWRSSWGKDFGIVSDFLYDSGCSVLYAEQRGQNNSGGDYMGFGLTERFDCLCWIRWIRERNIKKIPVYLYGISMGAATVLMASGAGEELVPDIHGIIADCGYTSPHAVWKHVAENNLHVLYTGWISSIADEMCKRKISFGSKDYSCTEALAKCQVPVLFIHGTDDTFVPIDMTYENYKACTAPKRLLVVPGAGHAMSYVTDRKLYEQTLRQFWKDYDQSK